MTKIHEVNPALTMEPLPDLVPFDVYRKQTDSSENYRLTGIATEDQYHLAALDPETVCIETEAGQLPAIVPLKYVDGFDVGRSEALTNGHVKFMAADPTLLSAEQMSQAVLDGSSIIVETDSNTTKLTQELVRVLDAPTTPLKVHEFVDPRIDDKTGEVYKTAWLALYGAQLGIADGQEGDQPSLKAAFEALDGFETFPANGLSLLNGEDVASNELVREQLWDLFKDRFEWLGDYHPISMEDTRAVFEEIVTHPETFTSSMFKDGELVCAGIFMHNLELCPWIKDQAFDQIVGEAPAEITPMYFFGIASQKTEGMEGIGRMKKVIEFHCKLAADAGLRYLLTFESSNMSSTYIPASVQSYINGSELLRVEGDIERVKRTDYWFISAQ